MQLDRFDTSRSTIATRTGDVSYVDIGEGAPALFVHGVGTNARCGATSSASWNGSAAASRSISRCTVGARPTADQDFSLRALADGVLAFCDALGLTRSTSLPTTRGAVAQIFAARHPDRLRTFTLTNCETHDNVPPEAFKPTVDLARRCAAAGAPALLADLAVAGTSCSPWATRTEFLPPDMVGSVLGAGDRYAGAGPQFRAVPPCLDPADLSGSNRRCAN